MTTMEKQSSAHVTVLYTQAFELWQHLIQVREESNDPVYRKRLDNLIFTARKRSFRRRNEWAAWGKPR